MNKTNLLTATALRSAAALGITLALANPAFAQQTVPAPAQAPVDDPQDSDPPATLQTEVEIESGQDANAGQAEIVVTGSRIRRPNLASVVPITSVGQEDILETGQVSVGDQLNQLPQLRSTFSQANSTRFIGTAGQNFLDLRGLGTDRTLALVNNRRFVSSTPGSFRWDVNSVPADLIERVDVVTGGNSAIYGSDAVAGVVNFVLRRSFEGAQIRAQAGVSSRGDSESKFVSGLFGKNFGDGRANVTLALEYAKQDPLFIVERAQGRNRRQFQLVQNLGPQLNPAVGPIRSGPEAAAGDDVPDTELIGNLLRVSTSVGGTFTATCPVAPAAGETAAQFNARRGLVCSNIANPSSSNPLSRFGNAFAFTRDGALVPNGCGQDFRGFGSGNCIGGLGSSLRESGQFQPGLDRVNATLLARYEFSPAFRPFFEGQFVHVDALQESSPTFGANSFSINNPFLTQQARSTLLTLLPPGTTTFNVDRQNLDFGVRGEDHEREILRGVVGVEGDFNDDWRYEASVNYGRFTSYYETSGNILTARFANARNAVRNASGQIVCGINADASTTNDDPACVPVNLFGINTVSPEALDYFGYTSSRDQKNSQFVVSGFVSGDLSQLFELPGGPIGFAIGAESRREKQFSEYDEETAAGNTFLNLLPAFDPPTFKVREAFGEIRLPFLRERPFFHELTVEAAARVSDYNVGQTGTTFAWNAGVIWAPVRDLRLRGAYQKSVRAPTLGDLFTSPTQTFNNIFADPCGQQNINNNPNRVANCAAAGVPTTQTFAGTTEPFTNRPASGVAAANRGNEELREETGRSLTLGTVFQPRFVPGFSLSVDFYKVNVENVIFTLTPQTVLEQCYDNPSGIDNPFCAAVNRLPNGTLAGQRNVFQGGNVVVLDNPGFSTFGQPFNYAKQKTSGIDFDAAYRRDMGPFELNLRGIVSYLIKRDNYTDVSQPDFKNQQKFELGDPEWRGQLSANLDFGNVELGYQMQYIGKQILNLSGSGQYETFFPLQDRDALDPDAAPFAFYPDRFYHDFRLEWDVVPQYQIYAGVDNAFDALPPYDLLGTEAGSLYDPTGRFFYGGIRIKF